MTQTMHYFYKQTQTMKNQNTFVLLVFYYFSAKQTT